MKKQIFAAADVDEPKSLVRQLFDATFGHNNSSFK